MLMNDYLKRALAQWGCALEIGLENHGDDFDLLVMSLKKLADPYRLNNLKMTHDSQLIETLLNESLECGALPLSDVLTDLKCEWSDDLFEVFAIEMNRLMKIV